MNIFWNAQTWAYIYPAFISTLISLVLAAYAWQRREISNARVFSTMTLMIALWAWFTGMLVISPTVEQAEIWYKLRYLPISVVPVLILIFSLGYIGWHQFVSGWRPILYLIIPAITQIILWAYPAGFIKEVSFSPTNGLMLIGTDVTHQWYYVHMVYSLAAAIASMVIFFISIFYLENIYRLQAITMFLSGIPTLIFSGYLATMVSPSLALFTPVGFFMTDLIIGWALFRLKLLDVVPIARNILINLIEDSILVLDNKGLVVDLNPAAEILLDQTMMRTVGKPLRLIDPRFAALNRALKTNEGQINIAIGEGECYLEVSVIPITDKRGRPTGRMAVMHDITELYRSRQEIKLLEMENQVLRRQLKAIDGEEESDPSAFI